MNDLDDSILHTDDFYVACVGNDTVKLDLPFVINGLLDTYFGSWRTHEIVADSIDNSLCFGVWKHSLEPGMKDRQVGFARVVTDYATFAWLCDVLIAPEFQKRGLGKFLLSQLVAHHSIARRACYLSTKDAHEFYAAFGFERLGNSNVMRRLPTKNE